jgi:hypothetical protein
VPPLVQVLLTLKSLLVRRKCGIYRAEAVPSLTWYNSSGDVFRGLCENDCSKGNISSESKFSRKEWG